jgi:hypothetical protein
MDQEPHHHLTLQNDYVKISEVEVSPGDSIVLHHHDQDTIAIGDQEVTVGIPGKPDVHQKNADAQVRLQRGGYVHSTHVDGDMPYHTVAVELLRPQTKFHNVCAVILPGQPLLDSEQTRVRLVRVLPPPIDEPCGVFRLPGRAPIDRGAGCRHDFFPFLQRKGKGAAPGRLRLV